MREDIDNRIKMIKNGNVPLGYKKTEKGIVPIEWNVVQLGEKTNIFRGASPRPKGDPRYYGGEIPRVLIEDLTRDGRVVYPCLDSLTEDGAKKSRLLEKGSIIMSCSGTRVGITGFLGVDACIHDGFFGFNNFIDLNEEYLYYLLQYETESLQIKATKGGVFNNLTTDIMKKLFVALPSLEEQRRIVQVLGNIEKQESCLMMIIEEKKRQKLWLVQNLLVGRKRLQNFVEEWEYVRINDIIEEKNDKTKKQNEFEILSVTKNGIRLQHEQFNRQIASEDNIGYKILRKGNLVFSTMNLWMGSVDVLDKYDVGMVSPAYKVFRFVESKMIPKFGKYYMKSSYMIWLYSMNSEQGASNVRRNLDLDNLLNEKVKIPSVKEQAEIAKILETADREIQLIEEKLDVVKQEKRALMQLLLTGIVCVNEI